MTLDEDTALELALECGIDLHILRERDIEQELADKVTAGNIPDSPCGSLSCAAR